MAAMGASTMAISLAQKNDVNGSLGEKQFIDDKSNLQWQLEKWTILEDR
jgi:hypothetical protein